MSSFGTRLAMNPVDNPLVKSLFVHGQDQDSNTPPGTDVHIITETGDFIISETGNFLVVE